MYPKFGSVSTSSSWDTEQREIGCVWVDVHVGDIDVVSALLDRALKHSQNQTMTLCALEVIFTFKLSLKRIDRRYFHVFISFPAKRPLYT